MAKLTNGVAVVSTKSVTLDAAYDPKANSIGALRLFAASMVVFGHAYPFGGYGVDPLLRWTNNQIASGRWPVDVFFTLSGFLLTLSLLRRPAPLQFAINRALRIFPAYWVCIIITGLLLPLFFSLDPSFRYVLRNAPLFLFISDTIPGLYEHNYVHSINSALWTLPWELYCYVSLVFASSIGLLRGARPLVMFGATLIAFWSVIALNMNAVGSPFRLFAFFYAGVVAAAYKHRIPISWRTAAAAMALLGLATAVSGYLTSRPGGLFYVVAPVLLTYATLVAAVKLPLHKVNSKTDISFGVYIYGTQIIQILVALGVGARVVDHLVLVVCALVFSYGAGLASWLLIERPVLKYKV